MSCLYCFWTIRSLDVPRNTIRFSSYSLSALVFSDILTDACPFAIKTTRYVEIRNLEVLLDRVDGRLAIYACMSDCIKGCRMPALNRWPISVREDSTGRRLTSLEGGNRGRMPRGLGRPLCYGDWSFDFPVRDGEDTRERVVQVHCRVGCIAIAAVFPLPARAKEGNLMPSAKRCPDRI